MPIYLLLPPLPTPIPIPTPEPDDPDLDLTPLWDVETYETAFSVTQTLFIILNQYHLLTILAVLGTVLLSFALLARLTHSLGEAEDI